jgi:hypothetical protein
MKRFITIIAVALVSLSSFANCFGKFGLVRSVYSINAGINIGSGKIAKLFHTLLMIFPFSFAYWGASLLDLILFNLVEFWTDSNPIAMSEYNFDGTRVREFSKDGQNLHLTYSDFGRELKLTARSKEREVTVYAFAKEPGKLFRKENGKMVDVTTLEGPLLNFAKN